VAVREDLPRELLLREDRGILPTVSHSIMVSQIDAAVAAEREACAKIAESRATKKDEDWNDNPGQGAWDSACEQIAERIRNRGKE
jgi:hypothetical protein